MDSMVERTQLYLQAQIDMFEKLTDDASVVNVSEINNASVAIDSEDNAANLLAAYGDMTVDQADGGIFMQNLHQKLVLRHVNSICSICSCFSASKNISCKNMVQCTFKN